MTFLVDGLVPKGDLGIIFGPPGCGKTWLAAECVTSTLTGTPAMGKFSTAKVTRALWVNEDMPAEPLKERLIGLFSLKSANRPNLKVLNRVGLKLDTLEGADRLKQIVLDHRPDLLVLDSLSELMVGDPALHKDVKKALGAIKQAQAAHPCTILLLAHTNRKGTFYGNIHNMAAVDLAFLMEVERGVMDGDPDKFQVKREKQRNNRAVLMGVEFTVQDGGVKWLRNLDTSLSREMLDDLISVMAYSFEVAADPNEGVVTLKGFVQKHRDDLSDKVARERFKLACRMGLLKSRSKRGAHGLQLFDVTPRGKAWFDKQMVEEKPVPVKVVSVAQDPFWGEEPPEDPWVEEPPPEPDFP